MEEREEVIKKLQAAYQTKIRGYLGSEYYSGKRNIDQLAFNSAQIRWKSVKESKELVEKTVDRDRLALILDKLRSISFRIGVITYPRDIIFKGLKPLSLKIFLDGTPHQLSQDKVVALEYREELRQVVVLYPSQVVPTILMRPGWCYSVQETYDLLTLGYETDKRNLEKLKNHENYMIKNIILGKEFIEEDKCFLDDRQFMRAIGGLGGLSLLNKAQIEAFDQIMSNPVALVQGPPGTGKTTLISATIIKMVKFLKWRERKEREDLEGDVDWGGRGGKSQFRRYKILVCADSNQGVNNLCLSLMKMMETLKENIFFIWMISGEAYIKKAHDSRLDNYLFRKVDFGPGSESSDGNKKKLQHLKESRKEKLLKAEVVFCTLLKAASLKTSIGYFSKEVANQAKFLFSIVDEATQTTQPRVLGALTDHTEKFVLVGDPKQLGPVIHNHRFRNDYGSLFENLIQNKKNYYCFLDTQYRMHHSISYNPNNLFYEGKLKNGQRSKDKQLEATLKHLFGKKNQERSFYYSIYGKEKKVDKSFYNPQEVDYCLTYLHGLVSRGVKLEQIGIIAMYNNQMTRIKSAIKNKIGAKWLKKLKVGTVDSFQGSEKEVIILSTVRANENGNIGFVRDQRRMNVALTRAKHCLIILGNSETFCFGKGPWRELIEDYKEKGLYSRVGYSNVLLNKKNKKSQMNHPKPGNKNKKDKKAQKKVKDEAQKAKKKKKKKNKKKAKKKESEIQRQEHKLKNSQTHDHNGRKRTLFDLLAKTSNQQKSNKNQTNIHSKQNEPTKKNSKQRKAERWWKLLKQRKKQKKLEKALKKAKLENSVNNKVRKE